MITTNFRPGSPCWIELNTPDVAASAEFYWHLFGWTTAEPDMEGGGYLLFRKDGMESGAIGPLDHEHQRPAWTLFFASVDAEQSVDDVERLGGGLLVEPFDIGPAGRMAYFLDPQGGVFGVWQANRFPGLENVDQADAFGWAELWTPDAGGAVAFYQALFGWETESTALPGGDGEYVVVRPAETGRGREHGGVMQLSPEHLTATEGRADWHPVFLVADCDASSARLRESGGKVLMGPEDAAGVGRLAVCADLYDAGFVLLTPVGP